MFFKQALVFCLLVICVRCANIPEIIDIENAFFPDYVGSIGFSVINLDRDDFAFYNNSKKALVSTIDKSDVYYAYQTNDPIFTLEYCEKYDFAVFSTLHKSILHFTPSVVANLSQVYLQTKVYISDIAISPDCYEMYILDGVNKNIHLFNIETNTTVLFKSLDFTASPTSIIASKDAKTLLVTDFTLHVRHKKYVCSQ